MTVDGVAVARGERARLRADVLRLGALLGWAPRDVVAFGEALTLRPWRRCSPAELATIRDEYLALIGAIRARAGRARAPTAGDSPRGRARTTPPDQRRAGAAAAQRAVG